MPTYLLSQVAPQEEKNNSFAKFREAGRFRSRRHFAVGPKMDNAPASDFNRFSRGYFESIFFSVYRWGYEAAAKSGLSIRAVGWYPVRVVAVGNTRPEPATSQDGGV